MSTAHMMANQAAQDALREIRAEAQRKADAENADRVRREQLAYLNGTAAIRTDASYYKTYNTLNGE